MEELYLEGEEFANINGTETPLKKGEYENCVFKQCNFNGSNLEDIIFTDCCFENCDLSLARLSSTALRSVEFMYCKLLGLHFEDCNSFLFSAKFSGCQLNMSSFFKMALKNSEFQKCSLKEVDFSEGDLTGVKFDECDLLDATFDRTNLRKADFTQAVNYIVDPDRNRIAKARFALSGLPGLLRKYNIVIE